jgi:rod shape-determining protein MreD
MTARRGGWVIVLSLLVALSLAILPLPDWAAAYRPEWVLLVLIYWCIALPQRVGMGLAWVTGLLLDALEGTLLGQHALAFTVVAYICLRGYRHLRVYPIWHQALAVLGLVGIAQLLMLWIRGLLGEAPQTWRYWLPSLTSMLLWPWVLIILRDLRRRFRVT